jgi:hypothetical protein
MNVKCEQNTVEIQRSKCTIVSDTNYVQYFTNRVRLQNKYAINYDDFCALYSVNRQSNLDRILFAINAINTA